MEAYPEAKVILTVRDSPQHWFQSLRKSVLAISDYWNDTALSVRFVKSWGPQFPPALHKFVYGRAMAYKGLWGTEEKAAKYYEEHNEHIRSLVPREQLLEYNVKQGWDPLCAFLGKEVPSKPYPRVNSTKEWNDHTSESNQLAQKVAVVNFSKAVLLPSLAVLAAGVGIYMRWSRK